MKSSQNADLALAHHIDLADSLFHLIDCGGAKRGNTEEFLAQVLYGFEILEQTRDELYRFAQRTFD